MLLHACAACTCHQLHNTRNLVYLRAAYLTDNTACTHNAQLAHAFQQLEERQFLPSFRGSNMRARGRADATRSLRMRCSRRVPLTIGGVDVRLLHYNVLPPLPPGAYLRKGQEKGSAASHASQSPSQTRIWQDSQEAPKPGTSTCRMAALPAKDPSAYFQGVHREL